LFFNGNLLIIVDKAETLDTEDVKVDGSDELDDGNEEGSHCDSNNETEPEIIPEKSDKEASSSTIDEYPENTSNEKPAKEGTWVSRFLGNKKSPSKTGDETNSATAEDVEVTDDQSEVEFEEHNNTELEDENGSCGILVEDESHATGELISPHGELDTIPEAQEDEEHQQEDMTEAEEEKEKPKKKGFGFSSFLTKFGVVSAATKPTNQEKSKNEVSLETPSPVDDIDNNGVEENLSATPNANGNEHDKTSDPIQQYVFGWDEDNSSKNKRNEQTTFQDKSAVSVPVA
jgi:hypothetical protein